MFQDRNTKAQGLLAELAGAGGDKEEVRAALQAARADLATVTQRLLQLERKVDSVPSRAELSQYQRRSLAILNFGMLQSLYSHKVRGAV